MKRQFEKVLDDFQPGLLESLRFLDEEETTDDKVCMIYSDSESILLTLV